MAEALRTELEGAGHEVEYLDLREAGSLRASVAAAEGIIFATPVYNFQASASTKNIVEWSR
jgi:NAD(P)H-dependent FMN reductase|tara:strand:+ start:659 stop:841 length:183 start_codon:yes stop_codon:yes gene_type:complete